MKKGKSKFDDSFKKQLVELYNSGKSASEIELEYHVSNSALYKWIRYYNSIKNRKYLKKKIIKVNLKKIIKNLKKKIVNLKWRTIF